MTENPDDELTTDEVIAYLAVRGRPMRRMTWNAYVHRGQAPAPARHVGRTPLYRRADVDDYLYGRVA